MKLAESGYTLHSLRHAFGLHLYESCTDIMTIKEAMGHKSLSSTSVYYDKQVIMERLFLFVRTMHRYYLIYLS
jgi:site-specific recombinase XerD